jgi:hypothetical protein
MVNSFDIPGRGYWMESQRRSRDQIVWVDLTAESTAFTRELDFL